MAPRQSLLSIKNAPELPSPGVILFLSMYSMFFEESAWYSLFNRIVRSKIPRLEKSADVVHQHEDRFKTFYNLLPGFFRFRIFLKLQFKTRIDYFDLGCQHLIQCSEDENLEAANVYNLIAHRRNIIKRRCKKLVYTNHTNQVRPFPAILTDNSLQQISMVDIITFLSMRDISPIHVIHYPAYSLSMTQIGKHDFRQIISQQKSTISGLGYIQLRRYEILPSLSREM